MVLVLTDDAAKTILRASENREPGPGHTISRHVNITKEALYGRTETGRISGDVLFFAAFIDLNDAAMAMAATVTALAADPFIDRFDIQEDGATRDFQRVAIARPFRVRYGAAAGIMPGHHIFTLTLTRLRARPFGAHVIRFYPAFPQIG